MKKFLLVLILSLTFTLTALGQKAEYKIDDGTLTFYGGSVIECVSFPSDEELHTVVVAEGVEEVKLAGHYTWNAKKIVLPSTLKRLKNIPTLSSIEEVVSNGEVYFSHEGVLYSKYNEEAVQLVYYPPMKKDKSYKVLEKTSYIYDAGFSETVYLEELEIYGDVATYAFKDSGIKKIIINSKNINKYAFYFALAEEIIFNEGVEVIGEHAFEQCNNVKEITLPSTLKEVKERAFSLSSSIEKVTLKGSVTLGTSAFANCLNLRELYADKISWTISPFAECRSLKNVYIKKLAATITNLPPYLENMFYGGSLDEWESLYKGSVIVNVVADAEGIEAVVTEPVTLKDGIASGYLNDTKTVAWCVDEDYVLHVYGKGKTKSLSASGVQKPWSGTNGGTLGLNGLIVHEGITEIGNNMFAKCSYDFISLPTTLKRMGTGAFEEVMAKKVTLRSDALGEGAFMRARIDEFIFPTSLTKIPLNCFSTISRLKRITLHKGLSYIGSATIPSSLEDIYYTGSEEDFKKIENMSAKLDNFKNLTLHFNALPFIDVYPEMWHYEYVKNLYDQKIVGGMSENTFEPDGTLTYGQALKILLLSEGHGDVTPTDKHWASGYLDRARSLGWISGEVSLDGKITRLEFCRIAAKAKGVTALPDENPFTDTDDESVLALVKAGVIGGMGNGIFSPHTTLTRAQIAKIVTLLEKHS